MARTLDIIATAAAAVVVLWLTTFLTNPLPVPSVTAAAGGLLGMWLARGRGVAVAVSGALVGAAVGVALHVRTHVVEDRADPVGDFALHVAVDFGMALLIAGAALAAAGAVRAVLRPRLPTSGGRDGKETA